MAPVVIPVGLLRRAVGGDGAGERASARLTRTCRPSKGDALPIPTLEGLHPLASAPAGGTPRDNQAREGATHGEPLTSRAVGRREGPSHRGSAAPERRGHKVALPSKAGSASLASPRAPRHCLICLVFGADRPLVKR